jgi:outer membrane protein assembly factor BamB
MKTMKLSQNTIRLVIFAFLFTGCQKASNWNQYLGPDRNATISGTAILHSWPEEGPAELWSLPLGEGYGGAAIFDGEVFILDRQKGEADILRCINLETGEEIWNYTYEAKGEIPYPGSRNVPYVDKDNIWSMGPHGDLYCFSKKQRKPVWNINILDEFDRELSRWGVSQAPLIYKDFVIVAPQGKAGGVVAIHKLSGEIAWKSRPLTGHPFHVSPILAKFGGVDQVIAISPYAREDSSQTNEVVSFDAKTGQELWKYTGLKSYATIAPPTIIGDNKLFLTDCSYDGSYDPVSILLEIKKEESDFIIEEIFLTEEAGSKMHPAVLFEDHLYMNHSGRPNRMICLNLEGEVLWHSDSIGFEMGGLILVDGMIINQNGKDGEIALIEPSPEGYREVGRASFFSSKKSQAWAPLAFSQGKLVIRDLEKLVCVDIQNP